MVIFGVCVFFNVLGLFSRNYNQGCHVGSIWLSCCGSVAAAINFWIWKLTGEGASFSAARFRGLPTQAKFFTRLSTRSTFWLIRSRISWEFWRG